MAYKLSYTFADDEARMDLEMVLSVEIDPGQSQSHEGWQPHVEEVTVVEVTGFTLYLANATLGRSVRHGPLDRWAAMALARQFESRLAADRELRDHVHEHCLSAASGPDGPDL